MQLFKQKQFIRFVTTGLSNTVLHAIIALTCIEAFLIKPTLANAIAYTLCTLLSYVMNTCWSFSKKLNPLNFRRFILVSLLGFMLAIVLAAGAESLDLSPFYGVGAVICVVPVVSFVLHRNWTYRAR